MRPLRDIREGTRGQGFKGSSEMLITEDCCGFRGVVQDVGDWAGFFCLINFTSMVSA